MTKKVATATEEMSDLRRLCSIAIKAANSQTINGVDRCFDILCYLKKLSFSAKDLVRVSKEISPLASLKDHRNPKISVEAKALFLSWMRTLYYPSICNNNTKLLKKRPASDLVAEVCPDLKKKKFMRPVTARGTIGAEAKKKTEDQRSRVSEVCDKKQQNLNKAGDHKSLEAKKPIQEKRRSALPMKSSENPRPLAHEAVEIKQQKSAKRNSMEMLELFEIAEKSADKASAKGILLSTKETSICVDTLSLLSEFTISSTAPETKRIMKKLWYLTKHKDRKICNSATTLLKHWRQNITDQLQ